MNTPNLWQRTRDGCRNAVCRALAKTCKSAGEKTKQTEALAIEYELLLHKRFGYSINAYKLRFRRDLTALRNTSGSFASDILSGKLSMEEFTSLDDSELISDKRKKQNALDVKRGMEQRIGKKMVNNINDVKQINTFSREKWGISDSAAKIDTEFDT